jgi:hypothetical protein
MARKLKCMASFRKDLFESFFIAIILIFWLLLLWGGIDSMSKNISFSNPNFYNFVTIALINIYNLYRLAKKKFYEKGNFFMDLFFLFL